MGHHDGDFKVAQFNHPCCITIMAKDHAIIIGENEGRALRLLDLHTHTVSTIWSSTTLGDEVLGVAESPFHPNVIVRLNHKRDRICLEIST
jgi:hypothetical protein